MVRRWSRQSEAVAVGLLEEDTWVRLGAGNGMLLDQSICPCCAGSPGIQSKVDTSHVLTMSWARLGLAALDSGTAHRSGQGGTDRAGANEEAKASTSASGSFMDLGFLSEGQKSVLHCIRRSGRDEPMRSGLLLTPGSRSLKFQG